ncbi:MAG: lipocalin family protein [Myxococcota bacterium]
MPFGLHRPLAWLYRQLNLVPRPISWQWLFIHLEDGRALYAHRPRGLGALTLALVEDGRHRFLADGELKTITETLSPKSGVRTPTRLRLSSKSEDLDVELSPWVEHQDMQLPDLTHYREGAADVSGTLRGKEVHGLGFGEAVAFEAIRRVTRRRLETLGLSTELTDALVRRSWIRSAFDE